MLSLRKNLWSALTSVSRTSTKTTRSSLFVTSRRQYSDDKQGEIKIKVDLPRKMYTEEEPEKLKRSIEWRSKERGMLETELVFQSFTKKYLGKLSLPQLKEYQHVLNDYDEPDLWNYLTDTDKVPERLQQSDMWRMIRDHMRENSLNPRLKKGKQ
jgi:succinate dehydrogenase flavin-adding protein (antitoxin of CptAB toxin-antitoxin module)